jgi:hypothetical protein
LQISWLEDWERRDSLKVQVWNRGSRQRRDSAARQTTQGAGKEQGDAASGHLSYSFRRPCCDVILTSEWRRRCMSERMPCLGVGSIVFITPSQQENAAEKRFHYVYDAP